MPFNIMFVDNAESVIESVKWMFKDEPYFPIAFKSPVEALRAIEEEEFAVVIADQSMPEMDGLEFLKRVKEKSPDTATIVMCCYIESDKAICALRDGYVFQFIKKPFDKERVKQSVVIAVDHYQINVESRRLLSKRQKTENSEQKH